MVELGRDFDDYGWSSNKGYGVKVHLEAIRRWARPSPSARVATTGAKRR